MELPDFCKMFLHILILNSKEDKGKPYYLGLLLNGQTVVHPISRKLLTLIK